MAEQENKNQIPRSQNAERASDSVQSGLTSKKPQLTIAEIQRIAALPRKKMRVSDTIQDVIIDEKTGYVYFPNPKPKNDTDLLLPKRVPYTPTEHKEETPEKGEEPEDKEARTSLVVTKTSSAEEKPKRKISMIIAVACSIAVVAIGAMSIPVLKDYLPQGANMSFSSGDEVAIGENVSIVQVTRPLIPGDMIGESDIQEATVSTETYNQITLQGTNLYQWQRADTLLGMYVQEYIPAGQYVSFASVGAAYEPPQTLWHSDTYIDIPLTDEQNAEKIYQPGEKVKVTIRKQTSSEKAEEGTSKQLSGNGTFTTINQSVTIQEAVLPSATVCDVLTGENADDSLYQTLVELAAVPAGEQADYIANAVKREGFTDRFNQQYLRIYATANDIALIGDISDPESVSIEIESTGEYSKEDDARSSFVATAQATIQNINAVLSQSTNSAEEK